MTKFSIFGWSYHLIHLCAEGADAVLVIFLDLAIISSYWFGKFVTPNDRPEVRQTSQDIFLFLTKLLTLKAALSI